MFDYEKDPRVIEERSFQTIRSLSRLDHLSVKEQQVAMRVVHSLGLPHLSEQIRFSANAVDAGCEALAANKPILCDVQMVKEGITKRMISSPPVCFLNNPEVAEKAKAMGETRSMAQVDHWKDLLEGAVVVIGNAPTALFRLLERIQEGFPKPALIIGMPVGFIGAAESKAALFECHESLGIECITLLGREGGSAVSSASCNALLRINHGEWY